ncbi:hypothetical protein [Bacillus thermotolerans]|uniref:hypothetical protein n=1 Tax=Bacillus thermotolerans TaxID=1221996 RepID=UPI000583BFA0|nr:hypothetical protein QY97_02416 [Bacillus thermotolerans]KKB39923.1 hypothetical protein QY96_02656 [Bacillus thermotolerans]
MDLSKRREEILDRFHACATCRHFQPVKEKKGMRYLCSRLQYETKPDYQFRCWNPKEQVVQLMKKKLGELEEE